MCNWRIQYPKIGDFQVLFKCSWLQIMLEIPEFDSSQQVLQKDIHRTSEKFWPKFSIWWDNSAGISNKSFKSRIDIFVKNKIWRRELRLKKTGKDSYNGANRCIKTFDIIKTHFSVCFYKKFLFPLGVDYRNIFGDKFCSQ